NPAMRAPARTGQPGRGSWRVPPAVSSTNVPHLQLAAPFTSPAASTAESSHQQGRWEEAKEKKGNFGAGRTAARLRQDEAITGARRRVRADGDECRRCRGS